MNKTAFFGILSTAIFLSFQNCGAPTPVSNTDSEASFEPTCVEENCQAKGQNLLLAVGNQAPIRFMAPGPNRVADIGFDVGGFCDFGEFAETRVYFQLVSGSGAIVVPLTRSGSCSPNGRFRFRVNFPSGFNYLQAYTLKVWLRGVDEATEVDNPTGQSYQEVAAIPF